MLVVAYDNARGDGDLVYRGGALLEGAAVETAALLSLFLDAPAREDDPVPEGSERRGWWGDAFDPEGDALGSRLWVVEYMGVSEALSFAPDAAKEALEWMVRDGLAESVEAQAERNGLSGVKLSVWIQKPDELAPSLLGAWDLEVGDAVS
ncbi:MAG: phage GP46 family protein [Myxococcota bacterium]